MSRGLGDVYKRQEHRDGPYGDGGGHAHAESAEKYLYDIQTHRFVIIIALAVKGTKRK